MRVQVSLEFMLYLAVSVASLVLSLSLFAPYYLQAGESGSAMGLRDFAAELNNAMQYYSASFVAYVPAQVCSLNTSGMRLSGPSGSFPLDGSVAVSNAICGTSGLEALTMHRLSNGTFVVG